MTPMLHKSDARPYPGPSLPINTSGATYLSPSPIVPHFSFFPIRHRAVARQCTRRGTAANRGGCLPSLAWPETHTRRDASEGCARRLTPASP